ncbi:non-hydrolyzing UDP-N-acetylglucosamine 2-epimerase [Bacillus massiliglaciei]|uniref:non-hydrolyzing UDP-N-acetylglucosamine 2-epimerase n=1 Tax=Bacillus massiliglaciei TaxID=1816693 RepID=UPI000AA5DFFC|nr:UDP-N-acetylglucosamine 2-epimerase (non-hydrolyzing) [Bacillus massiliglaciei]
MKVMTIIGTRPEIIRLSLIIRKLDLLADQHILVHTGQNYDKNLNDIFFEEMEIRQPDYSIPSSFHSLGSQLGNMFTQAEKIIETEKPDRILVLGDTNSALCAILAERMGIPVFHMEAGNRCFDNTVPEEINRKIIDSIASYNLPYTEISRDNLIREAYPSHRIWVSGNPIYEVIQYYKEKIDQSNVLTNLSLQPGHYVLVTAHRAENVDNEQRLRNIVEALKVAVEKYAIPVVFSVHPRTKARLEKFGLNSKNELLKFCEPFGFMDFIHLQKNARCVITDSGTVQEESCILGIPSITIRRSTERPETVMCGSNVISGLEAKQIAAGIDLMMQANNDWEIPKGYNDENVSNKVINFILGGVSNV